MILSLILCQLFSALVDITKKKEETNHQLRSTSIQLELRLTWEAASQRKDKNLSWSCHVSSNLQCLFSLSCFPLAFFVNICSQIIDDFGNWFVKRKRKKKKKLAFWVGYEQFSLTQLTFLLLKKLLREEW